MATKNKKAETSQKTKVEVSIFEKEISKLPIDFQNKLNKQTKNIDELVKVINKTAGEFSAGFYLTPQIDVKNNMPVPNFDNLTLNFLFDDFERPIGTFDIKILLGKEFDKYLVEEIKKQENGEEYVEYSLKSNKNIKFKGTSISLLRENCFDAIYDDLKVLGNSFVYEDNRGFICALKTIDIHRNMLLQKFEKYVVAYVGAGSWLRGEKSNDFDVFVVVDDTDVKRMPRAQVKDQLTRIIWQMSREVAELTGIQLHIQVFLLTDFWDALKDAHPVMFTFLRDGVPFYDRGIYSAWKELLKLGKIKPSAEAIDMHMNVGTQLLDRAKKMFAEILSTDVYNAVLSPSQAILMLKGFNPPTPKETVKLFKDILLKKEKCVSKKDVETLENTVKMFKKVEHDKDVKVSGEVLDTMIKDAEEFLQNIKKMFEEITEDKTKESALSYYNELLNQIHSLRGFADVSEDKIFIKFQTEFVKTAKLPSFVKTSINNLVKSKDDLKKGKLSGTEVNKLLKEIRNVLTEIKDYKSKSLVSDLGRKRLTLNYAEDKVAEVISYDGKTYLIALNENKGFDITNGKKEEFNVESSSFSDLSKYGTLNIDEKLILTVKKVLNVEEVFL